MSLPVSFVSVTFNDNTVRPNGTPENTNASFPITTLTAANYTAKASLIDALLTAIGSIVLGVEAKEETVFLRSFISADPASSALAQRENKWLMRYHDAVTQQKFQVSVGTADLTKLMPHSEFIDLTAGDGAALKTAFEAIVVSPDNAANAVVLDTVQFVGRNT